MSSENKFIDIAGDMYQETFDQTYDALVAEYEGGEIDVPTLEVNLEEQQKVLMNGLYEGETKFSYTNGLVDAHQFVLSMIRNGKLVSESK